jgi:hypothetical protein
MAISLTFAQIQEKFNPTYWKSIDEFEEHYIQFLREKSFSGHIYYTDRAGKEVKYNPVCHWPELKEYEVWMTGYAATGESDVASLYGKAKARNFEEACHIVACKSYLEWTEKDQIEGKSNYDAGRWDYDPHRLSFWGCTFHWSHELAAKTFG